MILLVFELPICQSCVKKNYKMKRRSFLNNVGAVAASSSVLGLSYGFGYANGPEKEQKKIRYAVLGLGFFSSYVIPRIARCEYAEVTALISSDRAKAMEWAGKYNISKEHIYSYDQLNQLADDPEIDAVYIATPVGTHHEFALKALAGGKHVLVEKTMAATSSQCREMIAAAKKYDRKLMVAYRARYEPYNQQMIEFSRNQQYGRVTSISAHKGFYIGDKLGKDKWRTKPDLAGGGALVDIGIYSVQACRYIAGQEPVEVSAFMGDGSQQFAEVEEHISFMMRFANGILATGSASWGYALQNCYRVGAEKGYYQLEPATSNGNLRMQIKETDPTFIGERFFPDVDQISAEFDHFSRCILDDTVPMTAGEEGLKDIIVIEALYKSAREGRSVKP